MKKRLLEIMIVIMILPQCAEKKGVLLKQRLIDEGIVDSTASLSIMRDSRKTRENEFVVKVSGNNLKTNQVVQERFKKIGRDEKGELNLVEIRAGGKWLTENVYWKNDAYVWISDKDGTLIYIVILSSNESIIFLGYR